MDKAFWRGTAQNYLGSIFTTITVAIAAAIISWGPRLMQLIHTTGLSLFLFLFGTYLLGLSGYLYLVRRRQSEIQRLRNELCSNVEKCNNLTSQIERMKADYEAKKRLLHWPHLKCENLTNVGFTQENFYGCGVKVTNDETRYDSTAHNVRASIRLRYGDKAPIDVSGAWFWYDGQHHFAELTSLRMGEPRWLLIFFWGANDQLRDFRAINQSPPVYSTAQKLDYGEWIIEVMLVGDNFIGEPEVFRVTLTRTHGIPGCS